MAACLEPFIRKDEDPIETLKLEELIAEGSFGTVYKATHAITHQVMAVKIIQLEEDETFDDLVIEIEIMSKCHSPNIVGYFGSWRKADELFIGMELCDGGSAADIYQDLNKPLDEPEIALICRETLHGLQYMHSIGYLHRDIKGANILIKQDGSVKLVDFGVSGRITASTPARRTFIGTPYWMAPEVIENKGAPSPYDWKADVWSLGITLLELAHGEPPLSELHPMKALFQIPYRNPPTLTNPSMWSPAFAEFLSLCLKKDPTQRSSVAQLMEHPWLQNLQSMTVLVDLVARYITAKKAADAAEQQEPEEDKTEEEKKAEALLLQIEHEKKVVPKQSTPAVEAVKADLPPQEPPMPSPPITPPPLPPPSPLAVSSLPTTPVIPDTPLHHVPSPVPPPTPTRDRPVSASTPLKPTSPHAAGSPSLSASTSGIGSPPQFKRGVVPAASISVPPQSPSTHAIAAPSSATPSAVSAPASSIASTATSPQAARPQATSIAQQRRPTTVHRGTARRTAELNKVINRQLLKKQLAEIRELTRQQQKEFDILISRQNEQRGRITKFYADKKSFEERKKTRDDDQFVKKITYEREAEAKRHKSEIQKLASNQQDQLKLFQRDHASQSKAAIRSFEESVQQETKEFTTVLKQREQKEKEGPKLTHKRIVEQRKSEVRVLRSQHDQLVQEQYKRQQELQRMMDEHQQQLNQKDEFHKLQLDHQTAKFDTEIQAMRMSHSRQLECLRTEHQIQMDQTKKLAEYDTEAQKQTHQLKNAQLERTLSLELEQHKRQQQIEYRDMTKELRVTQKKKLDAFTEKQKHELKEMVDKKDGKIKQKEKKEEFMKTMQAEEAKHHQDAKSRQDEEDEILLHHQSDLRRFSAESQASEKRGLEHKIKDESERLVNAQQKEFEEMEARHCREEIALMAKQHQEAQQLRKEQFEARRQLRTLHQESEITLLKKLQAEVTQVQKWHEEQQANIIQQRFKIQHECLLKELKKVPLPERETRLAALKVAQEKELEQQHSEQAAAEQMLLQMHTGVMTQLQQTHQRELQEDSELEHSIVAQLESSQKEEMEKLTTEIDTTMKTHTIITSLLESSAAASPAIPGALSSQQQSPQPAPVPPASSQFSY